MLKKFDFLFEVTNDVRKDILLVEENVDILEEKSKYVEIALNYIEEHLRKMWSYVKI